MRFRRGGIFADGEVDGRLLTAFCLVMGLVLASSFSLAYENDVLRSQLVEQTRIAATSTRLLNERLAKDFALQWMSASFSSPAQGQAEDQKRLAFLRGSTFPAYFQRWQSEVRSLKNGRGSFLLIDGAEARQTGAMSLSVQVRSKLVFTPMASTAAKQMKTVSVPPEVRVDRALIVRLTPHDGFKVVRGDPLNQADSEPPTPIVE